MKASQYFTYEEFDSPDEIGSGKRISMELVEILDQMRAECRFPFVIASGVRTLKHNAEVGGVDSSEHVDGQAVDIVCRTGAQRMAIVVAALKFGIRRIGIGSTFVHVGISVVLPQRVIWTYSK